MLTHIVCWKYKDEVSEEERKDHRAVQPFGFLGLEDAFGLQILDFGGDPDLVGRCVELRDQSDAVDAVLNVFPHRGNIVPDGGDGT